MTNPDANIPLSDAGPQHALTLRRHPVLGQLLDSATLDALAGRLRWHHIEADRAVAAAGTLAQRLVLLVDGRVALHVGAEDADSQAVPAALTLSAPDWFGAGVMAPAALADATATALDGGCTVAFVEPDEVIALLQAHPALRLLIAAPEYTAPPASMADPQTSLLQTPMRALLTREPVTVTPQTSIRAVAELMRAQRVSSVLLVEQERLVGIVTDRDLRNRALAAGLDSGAPVADIATPAPLTVDVDTPAFDALLVMTRHNIHHVPVMDGGRVVGVVTATDADERRGHSAVYLVGDIHKQTTLEGLVACAVGVKTLQRHLADAGASAYATGHMVTAISDALTTRLLQLGESRLGPPPLAYAWVAAGSQARHEQTAKSDQDNCMVLDDAYDAATHGAYFEALSRWTCDGLAACGYVHCPGEIMAMTDRWRQPRRVWAGYFQQWIDTPDPSALLWASVFFDVRVIAGDAALLGALREPVLRRTREARLFLALMVGNALKHQPPLGLFGSLSTARRGPLKGTLDLKHDGTVPVIDLARIYALGAGHPAVNTHERLMHAADGGEISPQAVRDLREAFEFLSSLRIRHQARQMAAGFEADNHLRPEQLSNFERSQLKNAFGVVKTLQDVLAQRYRPS